MPNNIQGPGPRTTQDEVNAIYQAYKVNGSVDFNALANDIKNNKLKNGFSFDDAVVAYEEGTHQFLDFLIPPEGAIPDPNDPLVQIWKDADKLGLTELMNYWSSTPDQLISGKAQNFLKNLKGFLAKMGSAGNGDLFSRMDAFMKEYMSQPADPGAEEEGEGVSEGKISLMDPEGLKRLINLLIASGDISSAIYFYVLYGAERVNREFSGTVLEKFDEADEALETQLGDLEAIDPESPTAQAETQRINQQISIINNTKEPLAKMMESINQSVKNLTDLGSAIQRQDAQSESFVIGNMRG